MRVSLIQTSVKWLDTHYNRLSAEHWVARCVDSRIVVLPEMFTTGFCVEPNECVESEEVVLLWLKQMSAKYGVAIAAGVAVESGGRYYNRLYVVDRDGSYTKYDKRHLFSYGGEQERYESGSDRVVIEIDGVRFLLLICYDLRFPVWSRNRGDYDVALCVANWPKARRSVWDTLLRARAIENLSYVCGVNIVGSDPSCDYSGGSVAVDFKGDVVASVVDDECGVASFDIDIEALRGFRAKFTALDDADEFRIETK